MEVFELLTPERCFANLRARTKDDALTEIAGALASAGGAQSALSADEIHDALAAREAQGSTGFGNEIAIPHARVPGMDRFILAIFVSRRGVEFEALDRKKVRLFFIILGPEEAVTEHLKILAFVSRALSHTNLKGELLAAASDATIHESFVRHTRPADHTEPATRVQKLLIVILYEEDLLYRVLELFIEEGIEGASIMESAGMGQYISNVPLFADFIGFMNPRKDHSKTILALVPEERLDDLLSGIEDVTGDLDRTQGAMVLALDVALVRGTMKMM